MYKLWNRMEANAKIPDFIWGHEHDKHDVYILKKIP